MKNLESKNYDKDELKDSPVTAKPSEVDPTDELMKKFLKEAEESEKKKISEEVNNFRKQVTKKNKF